MEDNNKTAENERKKSQKKEKIKKILLILLFLSPFILAFLMFFVYPLVYGIYISCTNFKYGTPGKESFNSFTWYKILLDKNYMGGKYKLLFESFWHSALHSFIFALLMVPIAILLPLTLAILVNFKPKGYKVFRSLIYLPSIVPITASGSIFTLLFMPKAAHGLLYEIFGIDKQWFIDSIIKFNIGSINFDVALAWIPIFLMCLWGGWGGNFIILLAGLQNVPKSLYEASDIDGCSTFKKIMKVTIPGIKPQIVLCLFTTIIGYLGLYGQNYVLGGPISPKYGSMPGGLKTSTFIFFIQDIVANNLNFKSRLYGLGAAASIIFAIFVGLISGLQMYCTRDRRTGKKISEEYKEWENSR